MSDNLFDDEFDFDETDPAPALDWLQDFESDGPDAAPVAEPAAAAASSSLDIDRLREKSTRAGAMDDDIATDLEQESREESQGFLARMSPAQRFIVGLFFLVDVCLVGAALLILFQVI